MKRSLTHLSLFSGIGGLDLAAEAAERLKILPTTLNNQIKKHGKQLCFIERGGKRVWSSAS